MSTAIVRACTNTFVYFLDNGSIIDLWRARLLNDGLRHTGEKFASPTKHVYSYAPVRALARDRWSSTTTTTTTVTVDAQVIRVGIVLWVVPTATTMRARLLRCSHGIPVHKERMLQSEMVGGAFGPLGPTDNLCSRIEFNMYYLELTCDMFIVAFYGR